VQRWKSDGVRCVAAVPCVTASLGSEESDEGAHTLGVTAAGGAPAQHAA